MIIKIEKSSGRCLCRGRKCPKDPKYINQSTGRILANTMVAAFSMQSASGYNTSYYCYDCTKELYLQIKIKLNPNLWNFE